MNIILYYIFIYFHFSFTLYPAHCRVGRENLFEIVKTLRFPLSAGFEGGEAAAANEAKLNAMLCLDTRPKK